MSVKFNGDESNDSDMEFELLRYNPNSYPPSLDVNAAIFNILERRLGAESSPFHVREEVSGNKHTFSTSDNFSPCDCISPVVIPTYLEQSFGTLLGEGESSETLSTQTIHSEKTPSTISELLKVQEWPRRRDEEFYEVFVMHQCEESLCDINKIFQERNWKIEEIIQEKSCSRTFSVTIGDLPSIIRIIHVKGNCETHGEPLARYKEVLSEILINRTLKKLLDSNICSSPITNFLNCWYVFGPCSAKLNLSLDSETEAMDDQDPRHLKKFVIFEELNNGRKLSSFEFENIFQAVSVFWQVVVFLALAENNFEFEHRCMHWENIIIQPTNSTSIDFTLNSKPYRIQSFGLQVFIKDYRFSRMTYEEQFGEKVPVYRNLDSDEDLFLEGDINLHQMFQRMQGCVKNDWKSFQPYTNILWLSYLLEVLLRRKKYKTTEDKRHKNLKWYLEAIKGNIHNKKSAENVLLEYLKPANE